MEIPSEAVIVTRRPTRPSKRGTGKKEQPKEEPKDPVPPGEEEDTKGSPSERNSPSKASTPAKVARAPSEPKESDAALPASPSEVNYSTLAVRDSGSEASTPSPTPSSVPSPAYEPADSSSEEDDVTDRSPKSDSAMKINEEDEDVDMEGAPSAEDTSNEAGRDSDNDDAAIIGGFKLFMFIVVVDFMIMFIVMDLFRIL